MLNINEDKLETLCIGNEEAYIQGKLTSAYLEIKNNKNEIINKFGNEKLLENIKENNENIECCFLINSKIGDTPQEALKKLLKEFGNPDPLMPILEKIEHIQKKENINYIAKMISFWKI